LGGSPDGQSGSLGLGGNGGRLPFGGGGSGGGGGGGLFGGGGGGSIVRTPDISGSFAPAGGGGGGSNLDPDGGPTPTIATVGPSVIISYTEPPQAPTTKEQCKKGGWKDFLYPDQGTCITFVNQNRP
jgi:hypothetical protein